MVIYKSYIIYLLMIYCIGKYLFYMELGVTQLKIGRRGNPLILDKKQLLTDQSITSQLPVFNNTNSLSPKYKFMKKVIIL
jgi:hypothetical protein